MKKKRLLVVFSIIFIVLIFAGCMNKKVPEETEVNLFKQKEAMDIAKKYLALLSDGDLESATKLYTEELYNNNKDTNIGSSKINAFIPEDLIESGDWAYALFNVVRSSESGAESNLDNITIKVVKENLEYKIAEVKSSNKAYIFEKNNALRMVEEDSGKSELVVNLTNIPRNVYVQNDKVTLDKEKVLNNKFGPTALSYTGEKIALTTLGDNSVYICVADIEKTKETQGNAEGKSSNEAGSEGALESLVDKARARKITSIDILNNSQIKNIAFSELEEELIVEYIDKVGSRRINIYKESNGELLPLKFQEMFPSEKYDLKLESLDKNDIFISVSERNGATGINKELLGDYKIDVNKEQVFKV